LKITTNKKISKMEKKIILSLFMPFFGISILFCQTNIYPTTGSVSIFDYSPLLILQRNNNSGGFTQGIQSRLQDGTNNWYFGALHTGQWIVSKGDYQNPKLTILENGNIGIGTTSPSNKLEVLSGWNDFKYTKFEAKYLGHQRSVVEINANSGAGDGVQGTGLSISMTNSPYGAGWSRGLYVNVINAVKNYAAVFENGNVGIGTINPQEKLDINGRFIVTNDGVIEWGGSRSYGRITWDNGRAIIGGQTNMALVLMSNNTERIRVDINGNVGIGTVTPGSYKLNVWGTIRAHEIVVNTTGADFVFEPTYKLRSLAELETFIKTNKHLPDIAPAREMQENGVSAGEMQSKLLQKVEELTLYLIEKDKEIIALKKEKDKQSEELEKRNAEFSKEIQELKELILKMQ
jgi:hypothetical protein